MVNWLVLLWVFGGGCGAGCGFGFLLLFFLETESALAVLGLYLDQVGLKLRYLMASASRVLGSKQDAIMTSSKVVHFSPHLEFEPRTSSCWLSCTVELHHRSFEEFSVYSQPCTPPPRPSPMFGY